MVDRKYDKDSRRSKDKNYKTKRKVFTPAKKVSTPVKNEQELVRLNKYIANAGICSRREADKLIESGIIKVNGIVVKELGTKISPSDKVQYDDQVHLRPPARE